MFNTRKKIKTDKIACMFSNQIFLIYIFAKQLKLMLSGYDNVLLSDDQSKPFQAPAVIDYGHGSQSRDDRPGPQDRQDRPLDPPGGFNPRPMESRGKNFDLFH